MKSLPMAYLFSKHLDPRIYEYFYKRWVVFKFSNVKILADKQTFAFQYKGGYAMMLRSLFAHTFL